MSAEPLLTELPPSVPTQARANEMVTIIRDSFAAVAEHADAMGKYFYSVLFHIAPETRDLFPANMEVQRSRLLRALVHVVQMVDHPDDLAPFLAQLGRDHRKFGVLARHYNAVGTALLAALERQSGPAWTPRVHRAWTEAYALIGRIMREAAERDTGPASWLGRVVSHRRLSWDVAVVQVQTGQPIPYRPGQYLSVETPRRPRLWRYLSPANAPREDGVIEFHVRAVQGGWVSRAIVAHSERGDTWRIGPPMGRLSVDRNSGRDLLMIAGGTGLAPIKAILSEMSQHQENPRTEVFIGGRRWDDLYDFGNLRQMSYSNPWLNVVPVVEEDDNISGAERGTLADVVTRYGAWKDHDVVVCGSPAMIRATVSRMLVAGTPLDQIRYDPFTMD
jgi:NAD(P)H-flavin reductase/hemoglobin-like flavoprotein